MLPLLAISEPWSRRSSTVGARRVPAELPEKLQRSGHVSPERWRRVWDVKSIATYTSRPVQDQFPVAVAVLRLCIFYHYLM